VDTTGNTPGSAPPSGTAASTEAAPPPAVNAQTALNPETPATQPEKSASEKRSGVGTWILVGIALLGGIGVVILALRQRAGTEDRLSIVDSDLPQTPSHLGHTRLS
jgi:hypothetical protein